MRDRVTAEGAHPFADSHLRRVQAMVNGSLTGNLLNGVNRDIQVETKRFFFHQGHLYNKKA